MNFSYRLYIRENWKRNDNWVYLIFSKELWILFIVLILILSIAGYIHEKYSTKPGIEVNLQTCLFYAVAFATIQGMQLQN